MKKNKKGFTLVELLAVIVVLIIVILIAFNKVRHSRREASRNAMKANTLSYIKAVNDQAALGVLGNTKFKSGVFNYYALQSYGINLSGKKPDEAFLCLNDYEVKNGCIQYDETKVIYENGNVVSMNKGTCKLSEISCTLTNKVAFEYTGNYQVFTVPYTGTYKIDLWGAQGGSLDTAPGGKGGYTSGVINLYEGEELYIYVGGAGTSRTYLDGTGTIPGGYNGGANGNVSRTSNIQMNSSGGGATDVRLVSGAWNNLASLTSRIMVAGGGGGVYDADSTPASGGAGGNLNGGAGSYLISAVEGYSTITPKGGTQTNGGQSVDAWNANSYGTGYLGSFGYGATGGNSFGGGGGGYWGGASGSWKPAGGGSSFISGYPGCVAVATQGSTTPKTGCANGTKSIDCSYHYSGRVFTGGVMKSGSEVMPTHDNTSTMTGNEGNGYAVIYMGYYIEDKPTYSGENENYSYTGDQQKFTAPKSGTYKVELWGAQGGNYGDSSVYIGGKGAYTSGKIQLSKGDTLYVYVGGQPSSESTAIGGYNGGGVCTSAKDTDGRTGGGATDVRLVSGAWNNSKSLASRIMVAAGGGGASYEGGNWWAVGGNGGALTGLISSSMGSDAQTYYGTGGTQTSGGYPNAVTPYSDKLDSSINANGSFGIGGGGSSKDGGAGGGGGYYGGGGVAYLSGGGGGSSYISGYLGCVAIASQTNITPKAGCDNGTTNVECSYHYSGKKFTEAVMTDGASSMPTHDGTSTMIGNTGNGYARITLIQ